MSDASLFTVKIGGQAGQGIKLAGLLLAKTVVRSGFNVYTHTESASLIRGGHNVMQVNFSAAEVTAPRRETDFLIALNQESADRYGGELTEGSVVLFDSAKDLDVSRISRLGGVCPMPLSRLAKTAGGDELAANTVALGALTALLGSDFAVLNDLLGEKFAGKAAAKINQVAAKSGYDFAIERFPNQTREVLRPRKKTGRRVIVNGTEAVALGAIAAGLQFAAIYPMSPISNILHVLAPLQEKYGFIYKQPEDEIAAVNMAIGASFAGARSLVATSGGGFCLMTEGYGLAGMTETPLVIVEGMRGGPATGLPTWSEQGDLRFILHAHQGDFPRIVLAAGDAAEAFFLTLEAFNLADKYQTPVVLLLDKNICENEQSFDLFDASASAVNRGRLTTKLSPDYQRYAASPDGVSVRTLPGSGNFFIANSDEHDVFGFSTEEANERRSQMEKRMAKLTTCAGAEMGGPKLFGPTEADLTIISWGSHKGSILQAIKEFGNVNYLHFNWLSPFPSEAAGGMISRTRRVLGVESNFSGQLLGLIKEKTGIKIADRLLRYDGRPFYPEEIADKIESVLKRK